MASRVLDPTPLVGRRRELEAIRRLLERHRLVTLIGVGGAGKTRLARRITADLARAFDDGAWLVELADVEDPELLGHTVATAIGMQVSTGEWQVSVLTDFLADRRMLLVLDNCEHLVEECAGVVDEILHACPDVRVLATSQHSLGLASESIFHVPPLSLPETTVSGEPEGLLRYESVALFTERATALEPGFRLTASNGEAVVELCRALDGIPLALELAAARIRVLSPQLMVERIHDRYRLLSRGFGGRVPDRQRSLEASVQWTHELCSAEEQALWARISVFRGGCDLEAIESVCGFELDADVLDLVAALVDKSVLVREDDGVLTRYRMLETLRDYGERQLEHRGELDVVRRRHRDHLLRVVSDCEADWSGPRQVEWMKRLRLDHANLRAALQYSLEQREAAAAMRLMTGLEGHWTASGLVSEARRGLRSALELPMEVEERDDLLVKLDALRVATWFALMQVDLVAAEAYVDEAEWVSRHRKDESAQAHVDMARGELLAWQGDLARALPLLEGSVELFEAHGRRTETGFGLVLVGMLRGFTGDLEGARERVARAVALSEQYGELYMRSHGLAMLGSFALDDGDLSQAEVLLRQSLEIRRELGDLLGIALGLEFLAWHAVASGDAERAATLMGAAGPIWKRINVSLETVPLLSGRHAEREEEARDVLRGVRVEEAKQRGAAMETDEAIAFALEESLPTPAVDSKEPAPLTPRETEVAGLVAEGLTNRQIADRLVISTRTAEAHVENILRKLGFTTRHAIASWVAEYRSS